MGDVPTFGTDGIRGVANSELTPELCTALGRAAAPVLGDGPYLVGRDPRLSGALIQAALSVGLAASGVDVLDIGMLPTPAIAFASTKRALPAAVISASHNPFTDNGIKFFQAGGLKLPDAVEDKIEALLESPGVASPLSGSQVGSITIDDSAKFEYIQHVVMSAPVSSLNGMRIVIDCANGATSVTASVALKALDADVIVINDEPNGININDNCGSTHPEGLQRAVVEHGAAVGLAFDGDGDRVLAVDENGRLVDGDHLLALLALEAKNNNRLKGNTVVATVMANLGFRIAMENVGIEVHETRVGDRYVLEALDANDWALGGEQSGHVILRDVSTTGDGLLSGVFLLALMQETGRQLSDLASSSMTRLPQVLRNVRVINRDGLESASPIWDAVREVEKELGDSGRVLLRPSGTEPLIRVMVEAPTLEQAESACDRLCVVVEQTLAAQ